MKKILIILTLLIIFFSCEKDEYDTGVKSQLPPISTPKVEGRVVLAYVTYYGKSIPDPTHLTHINYAFAELYVKDGKYEGFKLQGQEERFQRIVNLKKSNPDLKISIAFSHVIDNPDNAQGGGFSVMAKSPTYRKAFANDCKAFVEKWGIDGVDIDWEFPGISWSGHASDPAVDTDNYTLLMKDLRESLGSKYLLTYAGYCKNIQSSSEGFKYIDVKSVDPYVDFVNIMTYDITEAPQHQSALKSSKMIWDCDRSVKDYLNAGVPANKLVLGIPFYGRHSFQGSDASINYNKIITLDPIIYKIDNWDAEASVPYVTKNGQFYCGYDNAKSIGIKAEWLLSLGMKGMMFWDYDGDDKMGTLRKAVWDGIMKK